jgi:hypothetical protein
MGGVKRSVKPSAKPTLVRTQHLPLPAETARELGLPGLAGPLAPVPPCFMMCRREPLRSSGYGRMADGFGAEQAVHRTACSRISMARWLRCRACQAPGRSLMIEGLACAWPTRSMGSRESPADAGVSRWTDRAGQQAASAWS